MSITNDNQSIAELRNVSMGQHGWVHMLSIFVSTDECAITNKTLQGCTTEGGLGTYCGLCLHGRGSVYYEEDVVHVYTGDLCIMRKMWSMYTQGICVL